MGIEEFKTEHGQRRAGGGPGITVSPDGFTKPSKELAYFVGVLIGDASVSEMSDGRKILSLKTTDKEFTTRFAKVLCELTKCRWDGFYSEDTEVSTSEYDAQYKGGKRIYEVSKGVAPIKQELDEMENASPENLLQEFKGFHSWLLRGLWDSEGHVEKKNGRISFSTKEERIKELYVELLSSVLGIEDASVREREDEVFIVRIPATYSERFLKMVNPTIERKRYRIEKRIRNEVQQR